MTNEWAWSNGKFVAASAIHVAVTDAGFLLGATVAEQLRTFRGKLFRLEMHLQRLQRSLAIVGIELPITLEQLAGAAEDLAAHNHAALDPDDDLGLTMFVTPGTYGTYLGFGEAAIPQIGMHTFPLPFRFWADKYEAGDKLAITAVRQVPNNCWPAELKVRSRVHYYLADQAARRLFPGARAVLLDQDGQVTESSSANLLIFKQGEGIVSPPPETILPGVSMASVEEIAHSLGLPYVRRTIMPLDLSEADEILLCSTSPCVWPALELDGVPVGEGRPGPVFRQLIAGWNQLVGLDIVAQAGRFADR